MALEHVGSNVRAGDPFVCAHCRAGAHAQCLGLACECVHAQEAWIPPLRRGALRRGARAANPLEREYLTSIATHQEARRAADARRG